MFQFNSAWSEDGCSIQHTNETHTVCICNHLTNFAVLMDLVDDGAEIIQQLNLFSENMKFMMSLSVAMCIICIVIVLVTLRYFNSIFLKVSNHRRCHQQSSSLNACSDNNITTNVNDIVRQATHELATPQLQASLLRNVDFIAPSNAVRCEMRNNNIVSLPNNSGGVINEIVYSPNDPISMNNISKVNTNNRLDNINNRSRLVNSDNNAGDGIIVMRTKNDLNMLINDSTSVQYHHHHLHHHMHHHHHYSTNDISSHSSQSSPTLDAQYPVNVRVNIYSPEFPL